MIAGGWGVNLINTVTSGLPVNITYSASRRPGESAGDDAPEPVGDPVDTGRQRTTINYLNAATFAVPSYTQPFGNTGRNIARGSPVYEPRFRPAQEFRFVVGIELRSVPRRGLQPAEPDEFLVAEYDVQHRVVRVDHLDPPGAAASICPETVFLTGRCGPGHPPLRRQPFRRRAGLRSQHSCQNRSSQHDCALYAP